MSTTLEDELLQAADETVCFCLVGDSAACAQCHFAARQQRKDRL